MWRHKITSSYSSNSRTRSDGCFVPLRGFRIKRFRHTGGFRPIYMGKGFEQSKSPMSHDVCFITETRRFSSDLDGCRGALKREVFFHTFLCVLVWICKQTSSNQHLLVVGCWNFVQFAFRFRKTLFTFFPPLVGGVTKFSGQLVPSYLRREAGHIQSFRELVRC